MTGRKQEKIELNRHYNSGQAEFAVVYGRRRVGKTYLVNETFEGRITFRHAGLSPDELRTEGALQAQLQHFYHSLYIQGMKPEKVPEDWLEAFFMLEQFLVREDRGTRQVVFLDELPWMDTPRSGFITALEAFWNSFGCCRKNLMLIVCGSANSWVTDRLINNHGGLYGRLTCEIRLSPFTLSECEEYFQEKGIRLSRYDIVQSYMILGGIPYYLSYFEPGKSLAQNIDSLFFSGKAILRNEYERLFASVFANPRTMMSIVDFLGTRNAGYTRAEIAAKLSIKDGGRLTDYLNALIASDFVTKYFPFGLSKKTAWYKLTDPFCLFWLHFRPDLQANSTFFWQNAGVSSWRGIAFENVCFSHIQQIKSALGISGVITTESAWSKRADDETGAQIDMIITRNDNVVNMCEIKYYGEKFTADKEMYLAILHREQLLSKEISPKSVIHSTLITTFGLTYNEYSGVFQNVITLDDLFRN